MNQFGRFGRHLLDLHPAFGRSHDHHPLLGTVEYHAKVEFALDVGATLDQDVIDRLPVGNRSGRWTSRLPSPLAGKLLRLFGLRDQLDATGFAPTTGMYLRLDHPALAGDLTASFGCRLGAVGHYAIGHRQAVTAEQFLWPDIHAVSRSNNSRFAFF